MHESDESIAVLSKTTEMVAALGLARLGVM